jgi:hypothetical protein
LLGENVPLLRVKYALPKGNIQKTSKARAEKTLLEEKCPMLGRKYALLGEKYPPSGCICTQE